MKSVTHRVAVASCLVRLPKRIVDAIFDASISLNSKGDIIGTAMLAGAMGAKRTADLIPLCHQVPLNQVRIDITREGDEVIKIVGKASASHQTGVEMEALTAVSVSALSVYDMTKSAIKGTSDSIVIESIRLESKTGGSTS